MTKDKAKVRQLLDAVRASGRTSLTAPEGKQVCDAYGISVPGEGVAKSAADAAKLAGGMGFPVVMKIVSPDILHKTEAGGVIVGVKSADEASKAYDTILANAKKYKADAKIEGIQVQQMIKGGQEVIVGAVTDGSFGKLVAFLQLFHFVLKSHGEGLYSVLLRWAERPGFAAAGQPERLSLRGGCGTQANRWLANF